MIKKEVVVAIIIGLGIGLLITGGVIRAKKAFQVNNNPNNLTTNPNNSKEQTNSPSQNQGLILKITSPEDNAIVDTSKITLTGETNSDAYVAIATENNDFLITPNEIGQFSQELTLIKGANTIKITTYSVSGEKQEKLLNIVYTTATIE